MGIKVHRVYSIHVSFKLETYKTSKNSDWVDRFRNITTRFAKTGYYLQLVACVWGNVQYFENYRSLSAFTASIVFYCGHVTYQICAWFGTFKVPMKLKINWCLFERPFKAYMSGVFVYRISFLVLEILTFLWEKWWRHRWFH